MTTVAFRAPWSRSLRRRSCLIASVLCLVIAAAVWGAHLTIGWLVVVVLSPAIVLVFAVSRAVRGYELTETQLRVRRLAGGTTISLATLRSVEGQSDAMEKSVCLLANCGLFSFDGVYWSRALKLHRVMATDPSRAVVLRLAGRALIVTPHDPQQFIVRARTFMKTAAFSNSQAQ